MRDQRNLFSLKCVSIIKRSNFPAGWKLAVQPIPEEHLLGDLEVTAFYVVIWTAVTAVNIGEFQVSESMEYIGKRVAEAVITGPGGIGNNEDLHQDVRALRLRFETKSARAKAGPYQDFFNSQNIILKYSVGIKPLK